jgi:hypothetical protein
MSGGGAGISNGTRSRLNKSERQCEKEAERERAHNKMHDPAPISPANDIRVDLGFFSETESSPCRNLAPRSRANLIGARQRRYLATSAGKEKLR